jgi:serine/threonine-protein kinase RsbW
MERQAACVGDDLLERGLGIKLMKTFMDEVSFTSLGRQGKQTRLYKRLATPHLDGFNNEPEPNSSSPVQEDINYTVRLMRQNEALDVAQCAYSSYGYSFIIDSAYDAKAIRELNQSGQLVSMVGVTDDGEVMGHASMALDDDPLCGAWGRAFVRKRFRRQGCLKELAIGLMKEAQARNLQWVVADAVCSHEYSQRAVIGFGFEPCCLILARTTPLDLKGIKDAQERENILLCYRRISSPINSPSLFFPKNHADFIAYLYKGLGETPKLGKSQQKIPVNQPHEMKVIVESLETATIIVETCGYGVVPEVKNALRSACTEGLKAVYLLLDLADPLASVLTPEFEAMGFFFSGIRPRSNGHDQLVLQYLNNIIVDFDAMKIAFEQGIQLKEYIRKCESRVVKPWG